MIVGVFFVEVYHELKAWLYYWHRNREDVIDEHDCEGLFGEEKGQEVLEYLEVNKENEAKEGDESVIEAKAKGIGRMDKLG